jgi:hypothetical protein
VSAEQQASQHVTSQPASPAVAPPDGHAERVVTISAAKVHGDARWMAGAFQGIGGAGSAAYLASLFGYVTLPGYWVMPLSLVLIVAGWFLDRYAVAALKRPLV